MVVTVIRTVDVIRAVDGSIIRAVFFTLTFTKIWGFDRRSKQSYLGVQLDKTDR
jgi:hypothetical protein